MSLVTQLSALAARIGTEIKGLIRPDHPGLARAWANFGYVSGAIQLRAAYNVASVTRLATGRYRIDFETPFPDAKYCWVATGRSNTATGTIRFAAARSVEDLFDDPQVAAQGLIANYEHPVVGRYRGFRAPIEFGRTAGPEAFAAPAFGQHNAVLAAE